MKQTSFVIHKSLLVATLLWSAVAGLRAGEATNEFGRLAFVSTLTAKELFGVGNLAICTNGQFLYSAAQAANAVGVFRRDTNSGELSPLHFVRTPDLSGVIDIQLSPDDRYAVTAAYGARTVVLFKRDPETGELEQMHVVRNRDQAKGLGDPRRARFSPDGKHIYALDMLTGGITVLGFKPDAGFQWLQTIRNNRAAGEGGQGGLTCMPDGQSVIAVNNRSHALAVFNRDLAGGRLSLRQSVLDGEDGADQIEGQYGAASSADGKFVYVCSGRYGGDNSVSVFRVTRERKIECVQAFVNGEDGLVFNGGRDCIVTSDGRNVYAVATRSGTLACFARDAKSGKLRLVQSLVNDKRSKHLDNAACPQCSPDGRFVYVGLQMRSGISIFRRETAEGGK